MPLYTKAPILPRQARDTDRGNSTQKGEGCAFSAAATPLACLPTTLEQAAVPTPYHICVKNGRNFGYQGQLENRKNETRRG
jgi:hypothetical protein